LQSPPPAFSRRYPLPERKRDCSSLCFSLILKEIFRGLRPEGGEVLSSHACLGRYSRSRTPPLFSRGCLAPPPKRALHPFSPRDHGVDPLHDPPSFFLMPSNFPFLSPVVLFPSPTRVQAPPSRSERTLFFFYRGHLFPPDGRTPVRLFFWSLGLARRFDKTQFVCPFPLSPALAPSPFPSTRFFHPGRQNSALLREKFIHMRIRIDPPFCKDRSHLF